MSTNKSKRIFPFKFFNKIDILLVETKQKTVKRSVNNFVCNYLFALILSYRCCHLYNHIFLKIVKYLDSYLFNFDFRVWIDFKWIICKLYFLVSMIEKINSFSNSIRSVGFHFICVNTKVLRDLCWVIVTPYQNSEMTCFGDQNIYETYFKFIQIPWSLRKLSKNFVTYTM